ncbi:MAG: hypothetical protein U9R74_15445 [Pseudomonadota bacterium]|nr:hypothetical protein [Pseudomonadota bacterium]
MDYDLVVSELQKASAFDLYRLQSAIGRLLDDPARMTAAKRQLAPGEEVTYFDAQDNRLVPARILEIRRTRVSLEELQTGKRWLVPFYMINIDNADTDIAPKRNHVDRLSLRVGDRVGFTGKDGYELFGTVIKLNPKRAKVRTGEGIWAVPYTMLFSVIDGERAPDTIVVEQIGLFANDSIGTSRDGEDII